MLECNPDPAIPQDGSGCNVAGLAFGTIGVDGSIAPTNVAIRTGQIGTNVLSTCPPSQQQAGAGTVTCIIGAANGASDPNPLAAGFTVEGQTVVLAVDGSGNPTVVSGTGGTPAPAPMANAAPQEATITIAGRTLALTGPHAVTWWLLAIGIALLDLGYLAVSSTWTKKRTRFLRRS